MTDGFGRKAEYLRISLTDRCNIRCGYCMPPGGVRSLSHDQILTLEETARIAHVMKTAGIRKVRLTGGEPLIRKNIGELLRMLGAMSFPDGVYITTNATLLRDKLDEIVEAGIAGINISLDTLRPETFCFLTGVDLLQEVIAAVDEAYKTGIRIKLNCVPIEGINDDELIDIAGYAKDRNIDVRFIELMPIGCAVNYTGVPSSKILADLSNVYGKPIQRKEDAVSSPAVMYDLPGFTGGIGFISPMSAPFCSSCNRLRLTSEGFLKLCLEKPDGIDLKTLIRQGISDDELKTVIEKAVMQKRAAHDLNRGSASEQRKMVQIGG